jgi:2-polyprenyl-3-methyl-5-hydroxy-6-metoxy-1,4-benzoquinol methylase
MVHQSACPLCSSGKTGLHFTCRDYFVSGQNFELYKCNSCGFIFTQDYPEENEIGKFYESESYISHSDTSESLADRLYKLSRTVMLLWKRNLTRKVTGLKTGRTLDIGSGTGYFANTMKKAGWVSEGIEINEKARDFSRSRFALDTYPPEKLSELKSETYDCVTLWHVLEHFHDPLHYLSEIHRLLKPGASCIIALPNSGSYDAGHYKEYWAAWDVPRHLWHFTPATFKLLTEKSNLKLIRYLTLPPDVFYISMLSEKYKGGGSGFLKAIFKASFFGFLTLIYKERSSSVIYVLKKPSQI